MDAVRFGGTMLMKQANPNQRLAGYTLKEDLFRYQFAWGVGATEVGDNGYMIVMPTKARKDFEKLAKDHGARIQYFAKDNAPITDAKVLEYKTKLDAMA